MLKTINGRLFLTGTSAGSLYPVVMTCPKRDMYLGVRVEIMETTQPKVVAIGLYARLQKIAEGKPVPFTTADLYAVMPNSNLRIASPTHMSGPLGQAPFPLPENRTMGDLANECGLGVTQAMKSIQAHQFKGMELVDEGHIREAVAERFLAVMTGSVSEEKIEAQLDAGVASFDFGSLTDKFGPLPKE